MTEPIPFLDLITPHRALEAELLQVVQKALRTAGFIGGPMVEEFEKAFSAFCDTQHAVAVNSGTDALRFAFMAMGVGSGDAVVTVPHTFIATTEAISQAGALPEFVDIDERTYNMDPEKLCEFLESKCSPDPRTGGLISRRTGNHVAAIVPVHLYGQMADMDPILALADKYNLVVIEDACQAHGAQYFSKRQNRWCTAGSMGRAAAFSFYPGKNLGACGEAGAVTTNDDALARKVRMLRDHGQAKKYYHDCEGYNGRLDSIQAGFLSVKLAHLPTWTEQRRECAKRYHDLFTSALGTPLAARCPLPAASSSPDALGTPPTARCQLSAAPSSPGAIDSSLAASCELPAANCITIPFEPSWTKPVYHLYVVRVHQREKLQAYLNENGISTGLHYPVPLHLQKAYADRGFHEGDFPVTERSAKEILSLPMFPELTLEQQQRVAAKIFEFCRANS